MIPLIGEIEAPSVRRFGGKAVALDRAVKNGYRVPPGIVIPGEVYRNYLEETGLGSWLELTLSRKPLKDLRWEELWDTALRIRHRHLTTVIPESLQKSLAEGLIRFVDSSVAVRSSSPSEDSSRSSFAGLHDSFVDLTGTASILDAVREVWASLWSDRALMYQKELGLRTEDSTIAVIVQKLVRGEWSGVCFTRSPESDREIVIEAVRGLNESLVSGKTEPYRFFLDRTDGAVLRSHFPDDSSGPPENVLGLVRELGSSLEELSSAPQDVEWTFAGDRIYLLQSRPVTVRRTEEDKLWRREDKRAWYLRQRQTLDELERLERKILDDFFPSLEKEWSALNGIDLQKLTPAELEEEIKRREAVVAEWDERYWDHFIPFAHGVRLFAEVYNRVVKPESPFEFTELLTHQDLRSLGRNAALLRISAAVEKGEQPQAEAMAADFLEEYADSTFAGIRLFKDETELISFAGRYAASRGKGEERGGDRSPKDLENSFLLAMQALGRDDGEPLLRLARLSYKLRDDDNLLVGRIRGELVRAEEEYTKRTGKTYDGETEPGSPGAGAPGRRRSVRIGSSTVAGRTRQVTGTPASEGIVTGRARIIRKGTDLFETQPGEILVCDSIDPNITFVVPLVSGIVERRGGMLVHGAIIAREYGIPCITGVEDAVDIISQDDILTLDGFLGIVTIVSVE